ncbi:MAG: hypothetical protein ACI9E1_001617 [Cryomorphaceae bacterium]
MKANQTITEKGTSKWMTAGMCIGVSVVLHVVVAVMICLRVIMLSTEAVNAKEEVIVKEEMVIAIQLAPMKSQLPVAPSKKVPLTPQELKALVAKTPPLEKPKLPPKPKLKPKDLPEYVRTADDQLAGKSLDTDLQGERDIIAASNATAVASAPDRSAVLGEKSKDGEQETVDTTFQDGILEHMNKGGEASKTQPQIKPPSEEIPDPEKLAKLDQEDMKSSVESTEELGDALQKGEIATSNKEAKKFLEAQKKIALNDELPTSKNTGAKENKGLEEEQKTIANNQPDPDAIKQKTQEEKKKKQESQPKTAENKRASENSEKGFRSQAKATVMEGSISRRSKIASKNVKATPVGKYMAQISKLVEQEWQRRVMMHADLIQPGTLRIRFMVDERGKVKNISTIAQTLGSENQRSLTFQALTSVRIPPMPKKVKNSQGGDPLEFRYSFRFQ